jgi:glutathione peroxidase
MTTNTVHTYSAKDITGKEISLSQWRGKYILIVNVASQCGFTPQYKGLESLQKEMADKLVVLGFPCNQFGGQEPGDEQTIQTFCERNFGVTFPLFAKVEVNGEQAHPLYRFLKGEKPGLLGTEAIKWNFTKFLVDRQGQVIKRYAPTDAPEKIQQDIQALP